MALSYRVEGDGPPLLLVHGFMISFNIWQNLAPLLRPHFTLVLVELPGIGKSPLPSEGDDAVNAAIEGIEGVRGELGLEKWNVLGYSSGSRMAEAYIRAHAAHVCRAIFLCPLLVQAYKVRTLRFALRIDQALPAFGDWALSEWRLKFLISLLGFNLKPDPLAKEWYAEISARAMRLRKETIRAVAGLVEKPFSVPVPYVMIWGDQDVVPATPRKAGPHDYFVHGRHAAPMEAAEEVASVIVSVENDNGNSKSQP